MGFHFTDAIRVYIIYSTAFKLNYKGYSSNLAQRMLSHNYLGKDWTAKYRPWKLIFTKEFDLKIDAMKFEKWLKTGAGRDFIKTLPH